MRRNFVLIAFLQLCLLAQAEIRPTRSRGVNPTAPEIADRWYDPRSFQTAILNYNSPDEVLKYEKLEIGIQLPAEINMKVLNFIDKLDSSEKINPYLEWELKVEVIFTHEEDPSNPITIDAFFMKKYKSYMTPRLPRPWNGESYSDAEYNRLGGWAETQNSYPFFARFAPPKTGNWKYSVKITAGEFSASSSDMPFSVYDAGSKGYMQVSKNGRFLELAGKTFYPTGVNAQWPETHGEFDPEFHQHNISKSGGQTYYRPELYRQSVCVPRVYDKYKEVLEKLNDNGVNYFRTIMNPVSTEIEWETLGDYTKRLPQAQEMDKILELAEQRNMYIHWDMATHFTFKYNVYHIVFWDWIDNDGTPSYAYKSAFGLDHPAEFFTNEEAKKYYKQRLRYILSRWGYSTNIALFELICEISNIGSEKDDSDDYYHDHHQLYEDWQAEMGAYIKSQYNGKIHLLTASYSGEKHKDDETFSKGKTFDVMTSNVYDFGQPDFASFSNKFISKRFLNENPDNSGENVYTMTCTGEGKDKKCVWNIKPMLFSESDPIESQENCKRSPVELNRSFWQSLFSGLAASVSWTSWYFTDNYAIYGKMQKFISSVDLAGGEWHPGASELVLRDSLKLWQYNADYAAAMDSKTSKADIAYMRSGDLTAAIGVLTNKTYNIYNADTCLAIPQNIAYLKNRQTVNLSDEKLSIKGLKRGKYVVEYFFPDNQQEPIFVSEQKGSSLSIELPFISATKEGYIVLFRVRKL